MSSLARAIFISLLIGTQAFAGSASPVQDSKESGSITGRVTVDGKPARGVVVIAAQSVPTDPAKVLERMFSLSKSPKAETDSEGRFRLEGLPAGSYEVAPSAPTLVGPAADEAGKKVSVSAGATAEGIDFSLSRGGVITGKITDSEGNPLIGEEISLKAADPSKPGGSSQNADQRMYSTDDRGVYRIFGIRPGRYIVSSGTFRNPMFGLLLKRPKRVQTYYPGVTEEARAKFVEVTAGSEASGVDIRIGAADKGFTVSGRVIDAETGKPIADAMVAYSHRAPQAPRDDSEQEDFSGIPGGMTTTNARGEFRLDSLAPGNYRAHVDSMGILTGAGEFYADPLNFEVQSANIDRLEIKVHQGASISGVVVIENTDTADAFNQLVPFMLYATLADGQGSAARVTADSSFRIGGLKPGRAKISPLPYGAQKFSVLRVERDGVEQPEGIEIQPNEQITGVKVIMIPANCSIHGHVTIVGGPRDSTIWVNARPLNGNMRSGASSRVDTKGDFVIENIGPGEYEVEVSTSLPGTGVKPRVSAKQNVTVTSGVPAEATLVLNLSLPDK
jgi:protocatechuate 3,4-dioxygenase beta subunit